MEKRDNADVSARGFLSSQMPLHIAKHHAEHRPWIDLAYGLNETAQRFLWLLEPPLSDDQRLCVVLYYSRILSHFQAAILLGERGMVPEMRSILRGMLDALFAQASAAKHPEMIQEFVNDDTCQRLKLVRYFIEMPKSALRAHGTNRTKLRKLESEIKAEIERTGAKELWSEYLAHKAGMLSLYRTSFTILSSSTHSRIRDLERGISADPNGRINSLKWGPDATELGKWLMLAIQFLLLAVRSAWDLFPGAAKQIEADMDRHEETFNRLAERDQKAMRRPTGKAKR